jgi:protein-L-isoaspartate(D-aspartate) O-methyltransferase
MTPLEHRIALVEDQLLRRGIRDGRVVQAFLKVPRHLFVPGVSLEDAHADRPLFIGENQTISQPYMVARMTELLQVCPDSRILEIGTGSGYQTAILAELAGEVYTIERHPSLAERAAERLEALGYRNVHVRVGDGTLGWDEAAPFDRAIVTAGAPRVPQRIAEQIAPRGMLVLPLGSGKILDLVRLVRENGTLRREVHGKCAFVKLIGQFGWPDSEEASDPPEEP